MWIYLALGSAGIASTLYALWRAAMAETRAQSAEARAKAGEIRERRWRDELAEKAKVYTDQLARREAEIKILQDQRRKALDALERYTASGALRTVLRLSLGAAPDTYPAVKSPTKPEPAK